MDDLDNFLTGSETDAPEAEAVTPEAEATPEATETAQARARDEKGRFAPKGETDAAPAQTEPQLDHAALIGERRRRQEAEDRIRALEQHFTSLQQQPQQQAPQGPPDRWEDPDGYDQWLIAQAANYAGQTARAEAQTAFTTQRIQSAANEARARHPDYVEKIGVFEQMAALNPMLWQEMAQAPNPADYAYNTARIQLEISQHGGIDGLIAARVAAAGAQPQATPIPETLADEQSARGGGTATGLRVPTLDEILKR